MALWRYLDFPELYAFLPGFELSLHYLDCHLRAATLDTHTLFCERYQLSSLLVDTFDHTSVGAITELLDGLVPIHALLHCSLTALSLLQ